MTTELQMLSDQIAASTEAFLRGGGTITKLDYAGVPVDVDQEKANTPAYSAWGRNYPKAAPATGTAAAEVAAFKHDVLKPALAAVEQAVNDSIVKALDLSADDAPKQFGGLPLTIDPVMLADHAADMRPQQDAHMIRQLRALRADARRVLAYLERWAA